MLVPAFWAEARVQDNTLGRQITVRRWGWSETSEADALALGKARAHEALERIRSGDELSRREKRLGYNGAEGLPIREEIVSVHDVGVVTRNPYGARCLNVKNVAFIDIDERERSPRERREELNRSDSSIPPRVRPIVWGLASLPLLFTFVWVFDGIAAGSVIGVTLSLGAMASWLYMLYWLRRLRAEHRRSEAKSQAARQADAERIRLETLEERIKSRPDWLVRLYQTPAGYRALVMHTLFSPSHPDLMTFASSVGVDPVFWAMCQKQGCFRARVSPKPWRLPSQSVLRGALRGWPIVASLKVRRAAWIRQYEQESADFASCRYVATFGSGAPHPEAEAVRVLHDDLSRAASGLPIA